MHIQVIEGRFIEVPTNGATGMDRRAFGEFVGPGGELASYAFGWTTGAQPHVARLSIGIGAGNPGGGTFHAVVFWTGSYRRPRCRPGVRAAGSDGGVCLKVFARPCVGSASEAGRMTRCGICG